MDCWEGVKRWVRVGARLGRECDWWDEKVRRESVNMAFFLAETR